MFKTNQSKFVNNQTIRRSVMLGQKLRIGYRDKWLQWRLTNAYSIFLY